LTVLLFLSVTLHRDSTENMFAVSTLCQNISLYEPEQSLSLSQDEGEQCWWVP